MRMCHQKVVKLGIMNRLRICHVCTGPQFCLHFIIDASSCGCVGIKLQVGFGGKFKICLLMGQIEL